ncbi:MAG: hypothetical protein ACRDQZ_18960 [Mycobacteriales bacterium]
MASPTILDLITRVQIAPLKTGMAEAASAVSNSTASMGGSFNVLSAAVEASTAAMTTTLQTIPSTVAEAAGATAASTEELGSVMRSLIVSIDGMTASLNRVPASAFRAKDSLDAFNLSELKTKFADVGREAEISATGIGSLYGGFASLLGLGALGAFLGSVIDGFDRLAVKIHKFSQETGISTDRVQQFDVAMELLHVAPEEAEMALLRLGRSMTLAAEGSTTQAQLFKNLGVDVDAWKRGNIDLIDVLEQIQKVTSEGISVNERQGISMQTMGRNAKDMAILLGLTNAQFEQLMATVKRTNGVISEESIDAFTRMSQQVTLLWSTIKGQLATAFAELLPVIKSVVTVVDFAALGLKGLYEIFRGLVGTIVTGMEVIGSGALILAGQWKDGLALMSDAAATFKENWRQVAGEIKSSSDRVHSDMEIMWGKATSSMLDALSKIKGAGSEDILAGIVGGQKTRLEEWRDELENIRSQQDAFHSLTLEQERSFWAGKLAIIEAGRSKEVASLKSKVTEQGESVTIAATIAERTAAEEKLASLQAKLVAAEKSTSKERADVQRELNNTLHKLALEHYEDLITLDKAFASTTLGGTAERVEAAKKERDDVVAAWGEKSKQGIAANALVLEAQIEADKQTAENVRASVAQQSEAYKSGAKERISIVAAAIAQLKTMQDNLAAGKTVSGAAEPVGAVGPTAAADSQLRINMRRTESQEIQRIIDELVGRLSGEYRSETEEAERQALKREEARLTEQKTTTDLAVETSQRTAQAQIEQTNRMAQYDLITFNQKIALTRGIIAAEKEREVAAVELAITEARAEEASAKTDAEKEAAERRIAALVAQEAKIKEQITLQDRRVDDEETNHKLQNAQRVASTISSAFQRAFVTLLTVNQSFGKTMQQLWNDILRGFIEMIAQMIARWIEMKIILAALKLFGIDPNAGTKTAGNKIEALSFAGLAADETLAYYAVVNPPVAAAAAAAVFALGLGFASAREGFDVPSMGGSGLATILHSREMVLPEGLADNVRNMTSTAFLRPGAASAPASPGGGAGSSPAAAGGSRTSTVHHHYNVEVNNHPGAKPTTEDEIVTMIKRAQRKGALASI